MATRISPKFINELSRCEIFVFGSNLNGQHYGGAARIAYEKFGAEWGVGVGPTGQTYAIPTMHGGVDAIKPYVDDFIEYARLHPNNRFLLTRIGCGIAGFTNKEMAPLFADALKLPNVNFPLDWMMILEEDKLLDAVVCGIIPKEETVPIPKAINEEDLKTLCQNYKYIIGAGVKAPLPNIRVRYVIDKDRFGYAKFGDFFFYNTNDLYVFSKNKEFAPDHNQDMMECIFGDECKGRGYFHRVIFAGVETPFRDSNGEAIYTGDVLEITYNNGRKYKFALSTLGYNSDDDEAVYAFVLDNHSIFPEECKSMTRIGTVFYQLDRCEVTTVGQRCCEFQGCYPGGISEEDKLVMAKYTPNFDQEIWKYHALQILEVEEFNWRK